MPTIRERLTTKATSNITTHLTEFKTKMNTYIGIPEDEVTALVYSSEDIKIEYNYVEDIVSYSVICEPCGSGYKNYIQNTEDAWLNLADTLYLLTKKIDAHECGSQLL